MATDLRGRRAIVTGGGRSIGRALALGLARSGADVAIVYRERADAAEQTADEARSHNVRALAVQADTADEAQHTPTAAVYTDTTRGIAQGRWFVEAHTQAETSGWFATTWGVSREMAVADRLTSHAPRLPAADPP